MSPFCWVENKLMFRKYLFLFSRDENKLNVVKMRILPLMSDILDDALDKIRLGVKA